jgi:hypothetical protein
MLFTLHLDGVADLLHAYFATFTNDAVYAWGLEAQVIFHWSQQVHIVFGCNVHSSAKIQ